MTLREMNLRVFAGEPLPQPFFQPRFEPWFHWHRIFGRLPAEVEARGLRGLYEDLGVSMRYMEYYTGAPKPVVRELDLGVREITQGRRRTIVYETPARRARRGAGVHGRPHVAHGELSRAYPRRSRAPALALRARAVPL